MWSKLILISKQLAPEMIALELSIAHKKLLNILSLGNQLIFQKKFDIELEVFVLFDGIFNIFIYFCNS